MAFGYPVILDLAGVPVLLVGGGQIAARKAAGLHDAGALITVVAPLIVDELLPMIDQIRRRRYESGDIEGHRLVVTATDDPAVNAAVAADARVAGVWVNSADDPQNCSFILPAIVRDGPVVAAVSTGGASPALASHLRSEIAVKVVAPGVADAAADLAGQRAELHAQGVSTESIDWSQRVHDALAMHRPLA